MSEQDQNLIADAAILSAAEQIPCVLCHKKCDDFGYPVVVANRVYCRTCWFNARNLIPNT
jgi:hypothetical protein